MSDSLRPCGLQHARLPCPSLSPGVCSNLCPLSEWCHPTILSTLAPFFSCPQSFPESGINSVLIQLIQVYILFQILFHYRLLQDIDYSFLWYKVGPYCLFYILLCVSTNPKFLVYPSFLLSVTVSLFSMWVCLCFVNKLISVIFFLDSTYKCWHIYLSLFDLLHLVW